ncbi:hypothetical protein Tco_0173270 [Tanacetum coccineum]
MKESLRNQKPFPNQDAPEFPEFFEINELKAQLQKKNTTISNLKDHIASLKGKSVSDCTVSINNSCVISPGLYKLDLEPLSPTLRKISEAHVDYLKMAKEYADTLLDIVEQARAHQPLDSTLDYAFKFTTRIQELLAYVSATCLSSLNVNEILVAFTPMNKCKKLGVKSFTSASGSKPLGNTNKNRISPTTSSNQKNKVEHHLRSVQFRRTSLTGFPAQSIRSSNAVALDSPYLLVLITETSQRRQHVDISLIDIESRESPTIKLFDVDSGRISIHHCEY